MTAASLFRSIIQSLEVFTAPDFVEVFHLDCFAEGLDYFHKLLATCLVPLGAALLVLFGEFIRVAFKGGRNVGRGEGTKWILVGSGSPYCFQHHDDNVMF